MRGLTAFVHGANLSFEKELAARGKGVNIGSGQHGHPARQEKLADIAKEANGTLHMLDDFNGGDEGKRGRANSRGKVSLVEIQGKMRNLGFEILRIAIYGDNLTSERLQPGGHRAGTRTEVSGADAGACVTREHQFADEIVKPAVCIGVKHCPFAAPRSDEMSA